MFRMIPYHISDITIPSWMPVNVWKCVAAHICRVDHLHREGLEIVHASLMERNVLRISTESTELHGLQVVVLGEFLRLLVRILLPSEPVCDISPYQWMNTMIGQNYHLAFISTIYNIHVYTCRPVKYAPSLMYAIDDVIVLFVIDS